MKATNSGVIFLIGATGFLIFLVGELDLLM